MSEQLDQFRSRVDSLIVQVSKWAEPHEWVIRRYAKRMRDLDQQVYVIDALFLQKGPTRVLLDPVAYDVPGAEGVVDLYLMPTYDDMASLYFEGGQWTIHYPLPPDPNTKPEALPFSEKTILEVLDSIAAHATPSF